MKKVLIIDDAAFIRLAIKTILEKGGFEVVGEAEGGKDGIAKFKDLKPDLVTLDITMPEMNGIEVLKAIREHDSNAKVVMLSAMGQENLIREAVMNGAATFIVKPFKEEHLLQTLNKVIQ